MSRLLDVLVATSLLLLLLFPLLFIQVALELNREPVMRVMRKLGIDKLPLLFRVAKGKMSLRSFWREMTLRSWWREVN